MTELVATILGLGSRLLATSVRVALLGLIVMGLLRLFPRWPAAVRSLLCWLIGLQAVLGMVLPTPIALPVLDPPAILVSPAPITPLGQPWVGSSVSLASPASSPVPETAAPTIPVQLALAALLVWAAVAGWLGAGLGREAWYSAHIRRSSGPSLHPGATAIAAEISKHLGLRRCPEVRSSTRIKSPQVGGWRRPVVILPASRSWTESELRWALAHELAHVRRGDLWLGWVAALAEALLWFHPLLRWAVRQYALQRELACDQVATSYVGGHGRGHYAQLLLELGVQRPLAGQLAGASPSFVHLQQRLQALQGSAPRRWTRGQLALTLLIGLGLVLPYHLTAASPNLAPSQSTAANGQTNIPALDSRQPSPAASAGAAGSPAVPVPPSIPPTVARSRHDRSRIASNASAEPPAPPAPPAPPPRPATAAPIPPPPSPPAIPAPPGVNVGAAPHVLVDYRDGSYEESAASPRQRQAIQALLKHDQQALWWGQGRAGAYLIKDPGYIDRAEAIYLPLSRYWAQSGPLTGRYWSLRGQLEGLTDWQRDISAQQDQLRGEQGPGSAERRRSLQTQTQQVQVRIASLYQQLAAMQAELSANHQLGAKLQDQVNQQASQLLDQAIAAGIAHRYPLN